MPVKKVKRQARNWETISAINISEKDLVPRTYERLLQLNDNEISVSDGQRQNHKAVVGPQTMRKERFQTR